MIVHFQRFDGEINAGEFIKEIPIKRVLLKLVDGCHMQIEHERVVRYVDGPLCWRCWNTRKVYARESKKHFDCPACKYRTNYDAAFKAEIAKYHKI